MPLDYSDNRYDATNSWNGYNHQGKIALYYAVDKIVEILETAHDEQDAQAQLQSTFLEIEWTEDFSIASTDANGVRQYDTIHQVKDRQATDLKEYESAIQGLALQMLRHPKIQKAYLHVTSELSTDPGDDQFHEDVKTFIQNVKWLDDLIRDLEKKAAKKIESLNKRQYTPKTRQEKERKILTERDNSIASIERLKTRLRSFAGDPNKVSAIEVFQYELDGTSTYHCPKQKAKELVKKSLEHFYRLRYPAVEYKHQEEYIDKSYLYLLEKLNDRIVYRAQHRNDANVDRDIPFSDLFAWLTTDEIENMGETYYLYHIKEGYLEYLNDFCAGCRLDRCETCHVPAFKDRFRSMKTRELNDFVHQTNPNVPGTITIGQYHKFLQKDRLWDPFWNGLRRISQTPEGAQNSHTVNYLGSDSQTYVLTTLAASVSVDADEDEDLAWEEMAQEIKTICTEIYRNQTEHGLRLDGNVLLSKNFEVASVQDGALTINPSDMFRDANHIAASGSVGIVPVKKFRQNYMRKEHEGA